MDAEKDAWRDLLQSPGWALLVQHLRAEWDGPAFQQHVEQVLDRSDAEAMNKGRQLIAAKRAVLRVLDIPGEQIAKFERAETGTTVTMNLSRRGTL
jgi:hypothetical protein